jgi:hypothetical protein
MYLIIISLFQLSVVGLPVEGEEATYEEMATPVRPNIRPSRFRLSAVLPTVTLADELREKLKERGLSPAIPDLPPNPTSPLVNLLVSFCKGKILFRSALPLVN